MAARINIHTPPIRKRIKGFRLSEAENLALVRMAEKEGVDDSALIRYALEQLPGWLTKVRRATLDLRAQGKL